MNETLALGGKPELPKFRPPKNTVATSQKRVLNQQTQLQANFQLFYRKMMIPPLAVKLW